VIFVDTNVFMYAVGDPHPRQDEARTFFRQRADAGAPLVTSAEVLQELLHAYVPVRRMATLELAWQLAENVSAVWAVEHDDLRDAYRLAPRYPDLDARDLVHLACCRRRRATGLHTYDRRLAEAWAG
jgi:uncharacterized protein